MYPSQTIEEDQSMILINDLERSLRVTLFRTKPNLIILVHQLIIMNCRCFDDQKVECTSRSHDYSDLDESQMESINDWVKFYDEHEKYRFVGKVEV